MLHHREQRIHVDGLVHQSGTEVSGLHPRGVVAKRREQDYGGVPVHLAERLDDLQARADGHPYVRKDQVERRLGLFRSALVLSSNTNEESTSIRHICDLMSGVAKYLAEQPAELCVIFGEEDAGRPPADSVRLRSFGVHLTLQIVRGTGGTERADLDGSRRCSTTVCVDLPNQRVRIE